MRANQRQRTALVVARRLEGTGQPAVGQERQHLDLSAKALHFLLAWHEEALANLIYDVNGRKDFIVLSIEVGTSKTTMLEYHHA
jgi:hypothetical protein